eukprot:257983-Pelagomonas_calceolata.AAC.4
MGTIPLRSFAQQHPLPPNTHDNNTHVAVLGEELRDQQLALRLRPLHDRAVLVRALAGGHVEGLVALEPLHRQAEGAAVVVWRSRAFGGGQWLQWQPPWMGAWHPSTTDTQQQAQCSTCALAGHCMCTFHKTHLQAHALHHLGSPLLRVQLLVPGLPLLSPTHSIAAGRGTRGKGEGEGGYRGEQLN